MTTEALPRSPRPAGSLTGSPARALLPDGACVWVVRRRRDVVALRDDPRLRAPAASRSAGAHPASWRHKHHLVSSEGSLARRMVETLDPESLRRCVESSVAPRLDDISTAGPPADLVGRVLLPTAGDVACVLLGVPPDDRPQFRAWLRGSLLNAGDATARSSCDGEELLGYLCELVEAAVRTPGEAVLGRLFETARRGGEHPTECSLVRAVQLVLVEVYERLAGLASAALAEVLSDQGPGSPGSAPLPPAVLDLLDLHALFCTGAPVRFAHADIPLEDMLISAGSRVLLDERSADGLAALDCPASALARLVVTSTVTALRGRFAAPRLAVPAVQLARHWDDVVAGFEELPIAWSPVGRPLPH